MSQSQANEDSESQAEHAVRTGRAAVLAVNTLNSMLPDEFQEMNGTLDVEAGELSDRVTVRVELDRVVDLHRGSLASSFDALEHDNGLLHIEFVIETKESVPDLDYRIDMEA